MNHILDLYNNGKDGEYLTGLNEYLGWNDRPTLDIEAFKKKLELNASNPSFGKDTFEYDEVGFIYQHPCLTGYDSEGRRCKNLCEDSDSEILADMDLDEDSTQEQWDEYTDACTDARAAILDTCATYAVLIEKTETERVYVMLNDWYDPLFTRKFTTDIEIYSLVHCD